MGLQALSCQHVVVANATSTAMENKDKKRDMGQKTAVMMDSATNVSNWLDLRANESFRSVD